MAGGASIVHGVARLSGSRLGRAQPGGQVGVGLGNRGDRGAVELLLRGLGQKVDGILGGHHGTLGQYGLVNLVKAGMLGVRGANLGVARTYKGEHTRYAAQVLRKILARERAAIMALAGGAETFNYSLTAALARGRVIFDLVVGDGVVGELCLGAQGCRSMFHDAAHKLRHFLVGRIAVGAHRAGEVGRAGNNVARGAAVQLADGDDRRLVGANLARNDSLQGVDNLGGNHNGVVAALGHGAVA